MRGTHKEGLALNRAPRIIPAYAGNTVRNPPFWCSSGDHPRVCGEHVAEHLDELREQGSSPRMRGTLDPAHPEIDQTGIIPAYAGNTNGVRTGFIPLGDHPRVCGEHPAAMQAIGEVWGSSPRMRGTPCTSSRDLMPRRDHPRVCGEHFKGPLTSGISMGSSPRMRGTLLCRRARPEQSGIIPAYAGNTKDDDGAYAKQRDHPRVCGEHPALQQSR